MNELFSPCWISFTGPLFENVSSLANVRDILNYFLKKNFFIAQLHNIKWVVSIFSRDGTRCLGIAVLNSINF